MVLTCKLQKISYILKGDIKGSKHLYRLCLRTVKTVHIMSEYELGILMSSNYVVNLKRTAKSHWITKSVNKNVQYLDNFITFRALICEVFFVDQPINISFYIIFLCYIQYLIHQFDDVFILVTQDWLIYLLCLTPLSIIFQLYHVDQF